jgi:hypothetical protein
MEGVDLYRVKELLGHKDLTVIQRYSHLAPDTLRSAMNILEEALTSKKEGKSPEAISMGQGNCFFYLILGDFFVFR